MNLDVADEIILSRITDRWVHLPSGRVYNLSYNPPKVAGLDDETGEPLTKRPDDNPVCFFNLPRSPSVYMLITSFFSGNFLSSSPAILRSHFASSLLLLFEQHSPRFTIRENL